MKPRKTRKTRNAKCHEVRGGSRHASLFVCFVSFVVSLLGLALSASAQSAVDRIYARIAIGPEWMADAPVSQLFGPVASGTKAQFDLGSRTITTVGYKLTDLASVEMEFGGTQNGIHEISGATTHDSVLSTIPVLFNGKLRWSNGTRFTPYIGAGLGFSVMLFYADHLNFEGSRSDGVTPDVVFCYQAMGGVRYAVSKKLGVSLEYRYLGMEGSEFGLHDAVSATGSDRLRLGRLASHTLALALDANF